MGDVITLDGLETAALAGTPDCGKLVPIHSPVIGQTIRVCEVDVKRLAGIGEIKIGKKGPGRPRGKTVKAGARKPRVKDCKTTKTVTTKSGRVLCKCADPGNGQILAGERCDLPTSRGK